MSKQNRTRLSVEARRCQLLELGEELFSEWGYDHLSMDDVARAAGVSIGLVYRYFPGKRDFYLETLRNVAQQMVEGIEVDQALPVRERFYQTLDGYLTYLEGHAPAYRTLMFAGLAGDVEVAMIADEVRQALLTRTMDRIGVEGAPEPAVRIAIRGWMGYVESSGLDWVANRDLDRSVVLAHMAATLSLQLAMLGILPPGFDVAGAPVFAALRSALAQVALGPTPSAEAKGGGESS